MGAVIFRTAVADVDNDGIPDGLEDAEGGLKHPSDDLSLISRRWAQAPRLPLTKIYSLRSTRCQPQVRRPMDLRARLIVSMTMTSQISIVTSTCRRRQS